MVLLEKFGPLFGRILTAALYVPAGYGKIGRFDGTVAYITSKGLPMAQVFAYGTIALEIAAGLAILAGFKARYAALALAGFTLAAGIIFHNFWAVPEAQKAVQQIMFNKNLAITGGLLLLAAFGPGAFSFDNRGRS